MHKYKTKALMRLQRALPAFGEAIQADHLPRIFKFADRVGREYMDFALQVLSADRVGSEVLFREACQYFEKKKGSNLHHYEWGLILALRLMGKNKEALGAYLPSLIVELEQTKNIGVADEISRILGEAGDAAASALSALEAGARLDSIEAIRTIGGLGEAGLKAEDTIHSLLIDGEFTHHASAIRTLGKIGSRYADYILTRLTDEDVNVRLMSAEALFRLKQHVEVALSALSALLVSDDKDVRGAAACIFRCWPNEPKPIVRMLLQQLKTENAPVVRGELAFASVFLALENERQLAELLFWIEGGSDGASELATAMAYYAEDLPSAILADVIRLLSKAHCRDQAAAILLKSGEVATSALPELAAWLDAKFAEHQWYSNNADGMRDAWQVIRKALDRQ
ncbi:MAG: hypothetical protein A2V88_04920 [Elusimicrobia bacterium RBG_16_66_12]|nr:MAG: hypothetical protein A2V88_04920 [Elusimicrobia bacterium RBG_16_66_12]